MQSHKNAEMAAGAAVFFFGIFILYASLTNKTNWLSKREAMRERLGPKAGTILHWAAYSFLPMVLRIFIRAVLR